MNDKEVYLMPNGQELEIRLIDGNEDSPCFGIQMANGEVPLTRLPGICLNQDAETLADDHGAIPILLEVFIRENFGKTYETFGPIKGQRIPFKNVATFIERNHRHNKKPTGWLYGVGLSDDLSCLGVISVGRPVSRALDDGQTAEVSRLCLLENAPKNCASMLYGRAVRIAKDMAFQKIVTYTLEEESGHSLIASGWTCTGTAGGGSWNSKSRRRDDNAPTTPKRRWEKSFT